MTNGLRGQGIRKTQGALTLLEEIDFHWNFGTIIGLVGPNGAGKTTLLNVISGFLRPDRGSCSLGASLLTGLSASRIARLGVGRTFQGVGLSNSMTVYDHAGLALATRPRAGSLGAIRQLLRRFPETQAIEELLAQVGCAGMVDKKVAALSLGQSKRLAIACCFATDPSVLLLDEPLTGIDEEGRALVIALLKDFRKRGRLIVLIEHDSALIESLADGIVRMNAGRIV